MDSKSPNSSRPTWEQVARFIVVSFVLGSMIGLTIGWFITSKSSEPPPKPPPIAHQTTPQETTNVVVDTIDSVYDGDTFRTTINKWPDLFGDRIGIRIKNIDTPERRGTKEGVKELAMIAREFTATSLNEADKVELRNMERGKYFRVVADVFVDGENLGESLVQQKLAKYYDGGTRPIWTQEDYQEYLLHRDQN